MATASSTAGSSCPSETSRRTAPSPCSAGCRERAAGEDQRSGHGELRGCHGHGHGHGHGRRHGHGHRHRHRPAGRSRAGRGQ
ncbi:hypothetical protein KBI5_07360 [Frankia sp. KB5]|nr:hypothetical protein KBI5_07360 [Frankia sp. KB5]